MTDLSRCLIYGAYGYTGELIVPLCEGEGLRPTLAGRSAHKLQPLADRTGWPTAVFSLDDAAAMDAALAEVDVVLHCAGPFSKTCKPMLDACVRTKTHYLDITGEIEVFELCAARTEAAKEAGIVVMPGVGFDVVPSDCLAAHLKRSLPSATHLQLAFANVGGGASHGTQATMVEGLGKPNQIRRDGVIQDVRMGKLARQIDFGKGPTAALSIPWGDVSTAFYSTAIPNIQVYVKVPTAVVSGAKISGFFGGLMGLSVVKNIAQKRVDAGPAGPSDEARAKAFTVLWGEATDGTRKVSARLKVAEGYTLTALTALEITKRVLAGPPTTGFATPSMAFGPDFILEFAGSERTDVTTD